MHKFGCILYKIGKTVAMAYGMRYDSEKIKRRGKICRNGRTDRK